MTGDALDEQDDADARYCYVVDMGSIIRAASTSLSVTVNYRVRHCLRTDDRDEWLQHLLGLSNQTSVHGQICLTLSFFKHRPLSSVHCYMGLMVFLVD